jgi:hypothetical protein
MYFYETEYENETHKFDAVFFETFPAVKKL